MRGAVCGNAASAAGLGADPDRRRAMASNDHMYTRSREATRSAKVEAKRNAITDVTSTASPRMDAQKIVLVLLMVVDGARADYAAAPRTQQGRCSRK